MISCAPPRSSCTTTWTAACGPGRSSSWPRRPATRACPTTDVDELSGWFYDGRQLRLAGALPGDLRPHRGRHADPGGAGPGGRRSAPRTWRPDGVVYAEVRYAPELHVASGMELPAVVEAVNEGFREGRALAAAAGHADPGRRPAHRDAPRRPLDGDRRAGGALPRRRGGRASTSRAPRPATRRPGTWTRSSTSSGRTPTSRSTRARASGCRRSGRRSSGAAPTGSGTACGSSTTSPSGPTARPRLGPARGLRAGQADPAGDGADVQRHDRRGRGPSPSTRSGCCAGCSFRVTINTDNRLMSGTR